MKPKLTIILFLMFSGLYGQNTVVDKTDKSESSIENPIYDIEIIEPKSDTINLTNKESFSLVIRYKGVWNSFHIIDYPTDTYATLNNIKEPETNEEYSALLLDEWAKFNVIIPKHEILKEVDLGRCIIRELKITSDKITHSEIYLDSKLIKTIYYEKE